MELSIFYLACNNLFYSVTALKVLDVAQGYAIMAFPKITSWPRADGEMRNVRLPVISLTEAAVSFSSVK